jgi:phosphatidylglycerophosphate synthase
VNAYLNPANAITASRYLTLPLFAVQVDRGDYQLAVVTLIACGVLDLIDGPVARALKCTSGFGEFFDAVTDGVCYGFFLAVVAAYHRVAWLPVVAIIGLGLVNAVFRVVYARRLGRAANYRSYAMERVLAIVVFLPGLAITGFLPDYYAWLCLALLAVVVAYDAKRMLIDPIPEAAG